MKEKNLGRISLGNKPYVNEIMVIIIAEIIKCKFFLFVKIVRLEVEISLANLFV